MNYDKALKSERDQLIKSPYVSSGIMQHVILAKKCISEMFKVICVCAEIAKHNFERLINFRQGLEAFLQKF